MAKKKQYKHVKAKTVQEIDVKLAFEPSKTQKYIIYSLLIILPALLAAYYVYHALSVNGYFGFPLDDPWIHLTFAKNLVEFQSFSFFKNEMITSGSTSPVYTFLLAAVYIFYKNEFILSYIIGILFFCFSSYFVYRLSSLEFRKENLYALAVSVLFILDRHMNFISNSGMETTMFIFILIAAAYFYRKRQAVPFAVFLGLTIWGRPDGAAFIAAVIIDYAVLYVLSKKDKSVKLFDKKDIRNIIIASSAFIICYFILNFILSGSILPNTYAAKTTYYTPEYRSRLMFLKLEVWDYFTYGVYTLIIIGFFIAFLKLLYDIFKSKYNPNLLYFAFILILISLYWYKLPYAHRFGRYLMPVIPFFILISITGYREFLIITAKYFKNKTVLQYTGVLLLSAGIIWSVINYKENINTYTEHCKYINDRQVTAAIWLRDNTNENDIVATHDIGAIGFYSNRKIVDVAGLVNPELISKIQDRDYNNYMTGYMKQQGVTYIAFLREWYRIVNQNPLFTTAETMPPEIMEIFKFIPGKTYILPSMTKSCLMEAEKYFGQRNPQAMRSVLQVLVQCRDLSPDCAFTYFLLANAYLALNDKANYENNIKKALEIFPDDKYSLQLAANYSKNERKFEEAKNYYEKYLSFFPDDEKAKSSLQAVLDSLKNK